MTLSNLPLKKGQRIKVRIEEVEIKRGITAAEFVGMWSDRKDIQDSSEYSRKLRDEMQSRDLDGE